MNNTLNNIEEILGHQICGFHQYILTSPVHLNYVSVNLCEMLGIQQTELLDDRADIYAQWCILLTVKSTQPLFKKSL